MTEEKREEKVLSIEERVRLGETIFGEEGEQIKEAIDVPSFYLRGVIPGRQGEENSDDPNFDPIKTGLVPQDVLPSDKDRLEMQNSSMKRYLKDPNYFSIIEGYLAFIVGKGFRVSADDENPAVSDLVREFIEINRFNGRDRQIILKCLKAGEMFVRMSFEDAAGKPARIPIIRCLNYWEITKIVFADGDKETPKEYVREYMDGTDRREEKIPADEIVHFKIADFDQARALPPFGVIAAWCQYYIDWLFNRVVLNRLKTSYYLEEIVDGSPAATTGAADQDTTQNKTSKTGKKILRMPKPGSKLIHNKAVEYKWLKPEVGADDAKEDGRVIRLAICSGAVAPEFLLGDASNAAYASTLVSQNPFVRRIEMFQDLFTPLFAEIFRRVIDNAVKNGFLKGKSTETVAVESAKNVGFLRRIVGRLRAKFHPDFTKIQENTLGHVMKERVNDDGDVVVSKVVATKTTVTIQWPTLIAQDVLKDTQALQIQKAMGVVSTQTVRERLGYDDAEEERRIMAEDKGSEGDEEPTGEELDKQINDLKGKAGDDDQQPEDAGIPGKKAKKSPKE